MNATRAATPAADGSMPVEPPLALANPDAAHWDRECDVLVVGLGAAGAAAAIAAREVDADVIVVERFEGGGASTKSGGVVYAGGGTRHQIKAGYADTPEAMFNYLRLETGDAISEATLRRFCDDSRGLIEWLESIGAAFESDAVPPKTSYPKNGVYLYYSGNEGVSPFCDAAKPAPRGHRMNDTGMSGKALFGVLRRKVESLNIPLMQQSAVHRLIIDSAGDRVIGAEVWQLVPGSPAAATHQKLMRRAEAVHNVAPKWADKLRAKALTLEMSESRPLAIRAKRGVVLSTGGFIFNREMVAEHAPKYLQTMRLGATGCDGSGIRLGQTVGGAAARLHKVSAWRFINPPQPWARGIVVDAQGQRFCNEASYGARLGVEMCENHDGRAWLVLDSRLRKAAFREAFFGGLWAFQSIPAIFLMLFAPRAKTPEQLADKLGMPPAALRATVDAYNTAARGDAKDTLGKATPMMQALDQGPYYAFEISAHSKTFPCPAITLGGLRVDEDSGAVLRADGHTIAGLYAAGRAAIGIASNGYVSGLSLADCLWSGRRAGRHLGETT
ncbi:MAG: FAD-binding protein [Stenotrophobium sp.]